MQNVVSFYERLPRGSAPEPKPRGLLGWYQAKYMGRNPSAMRKFPKPGLGHTGGGEHRADLRMRTALVHLIAALTLFGYAQNYYFHLRESLHLH